MALTKVIGDGLATSGLPAGSVLQIQVGSINDIYSSTSTSFADVTGFNVSITPTSSSSTILVSFSTVAGNTNTSRPSRFRVMSFTTGGSFPASIVPQASRMAVRDNYLSFDSATGGGTLQVNNRHNDDMSQTSTITVMEIAG